MKIEIELRGFDEEKRVIHTNLGDICLDKTEGMHCRFVVSEATAPLLRGLLSLALKKKKRLRLCVEEEGGVLTDFCSPEAYFSAYQQTIQG